MVLNKCLDIPATIHSLASNHTPEDETWNHNPGAVFDVSLSTDQSDLVSVERRLMGLNMDPEHSGQGLPVSL